MPNQTIFEIQASLCCTMSHALQLEIVHLLRDGPMRVMDIAQHQSGTNRARSLAT